MSFLSFLLSSTTQDIEKAFLQENPKILLSLFPEKAYINISMPDPISFSDYVSNQQAYFLFRKIFSSYTTFEFYSEKQFLIRPRKDFIIKASWSFRDNKTGTQFVYHVFFYVTFVPKKGKSPPSASWKITEVRAVKS